jgi:tRNA/rRNA methyltransferase
MKMKQISIILVNPQMGENIGATARAMLNAGLVDLRLVAPRDGWPNPKADAMASGAIEVLENAKVFATTQEAIEDLNFVLATTARLRDMEKEIFTPNSAAKECVARINNSQKCGVLFGCERSGLSNDDVVLADAIINVPLNPNFSSLNLAQAVLLITYEFYQATLSKDDLEAIKIKSSPAPKKELEFFLSKLESDLDEVKFFSNPGQKPNTMRNIRNLFDRAELSSQEIRTLFGIIKSLKK